MERPVALLSWCFSLIFFVLVFQKVVFGQTKAESSQYREDEGLYMSEFQQKQAVQSAMSSVRSDRSSSSIFVVGLVVVAKEVAVGFDCFFFL